MSDLRVLALTRYSRLGASSRVRVYQYVDALREHGVLLDVQPLLGDPYVRGIYGLGPRATNGYIARRYATRLLSLARRHRYDLVWVQKEALPFLPAPIENLALGSAFAIDIDDAIHLRYAEHRHTIVRTLLGTKIRNIMARSRVVIAGNEHLADIARGSGAATVVMVPTVVPLSSYPRANVHERDSLTVGWIGSPKTVHYLQELIPTLESLDFDISLRVIGARVDTTLPTETIAWSEATEASEIARCDVGIMPLSGSNWDLGKCAYKAIQYMAAGRPVIASRVGANRQVIENGVTGFTVEAVDGWRTRLHQLRDPDLRRSLGEAARHAVASRYCVEAQTPILANALRAAACSRRSS